MNNNIALTFDTKSLDGVIKKMEKAGKSAQEFKMPTAAVKQINDVTEEMARLKDEIDKINDAINGKLDKSSFEGYTKAITNYVNTMKESFDELRETLKSFSDFEGFEKVVSYVDEADKKIVTSEKKLNREITKMEKELDASSKKITGSGKKAASSQVNDVKQVLDTTKNIGKEQDKNIQKTKDENKELERQSELLSDIDNKKSKRSKKAAQQVEEIKTEGTTVVQGKLQLEEGAEDKFRADVFDIVRRVNDDPPTVKARVEFESGYKSQEKKKAIRKLNDDLSKVLEINPDDEQLQKSVEKMRKDLQKELHYDDSDTMFQFTTNIKKISSDIKTTLKELGESLGKIPLNADVHLDNAQIQEQLKGLQNFTLTIDNIDFRESFIKSLESVDELLKEKEKLEDDDAKILSEEETERVKNFIDKSMDLKKVLAKISKQLSTIELSASFDKDQVQGALDLIDGLSVKIDSLDLSGLKKQIGLKGLPVYVGGQGGGGFAGYGEGGPSDNNVDSNEIDKVNDELHEFVSSLDKASESIEFTDKGVIKQTMSNLKGLNEFVKEFKTPQSGRTLLDWALNTTKLGTGETLTKNLQILTEGIYDYKSKQRKGGLTAYARMNKIKTPKEISSQLSSKDEKGEYIYLSKSGGLKKNSDKLVEELFQSMVLYGVNKDTQHSFSSMLSESLTKAFDSDEMNSKLVAQLREGFMDKYSPYGALWNQTIKMPTTPQKTPSVKPILDDALANLPATSDKLGDLDADVSQYIKLLGTDLSRLDKTLKEALDEVQNTDEFMSLSKDYKTQKDVKLRREELMGSIFSQLSHLSPKEYNNLMGEIEKGNYKHIGGFISALQKQSPEEWSIIQQRRSSVINEEIKRRAKRIDRDETGAYSMNVEENVKKIDYLVDYLYDTFPKMENTKGDFSFKNLKALLELDNKSLKAIKERYRAREADEEATQKIMSLGGTDWLLQTNDEEIEKVGEGLAKDVIENMKEKAKLVQETYETALKQAQEASEKESQKKKPRIKTEKERVKEHQQNKPTTLAPTIETKKEEVESIDESVASLQALSQQVTKRVDLDNLSEKYTVEVQKMLERYYERLADIEQLKEKIAELKGKKVADLTDEDIEETIYNIFPNSPESAKTALTGLKKYDEYIAEATRLNEKLRELQKKYAEVDKAETKKEMPTIPLAEFSKENIESIETLTSAIKIDKTGQVKQTKANQENINKVVNEIVKSLFDNDKEKYQAVDISSLREKISVPGVEVFLEDLRKERAVNRTLTEEFEKVASQMKALSDEHKEDTQEYKELALKKEDINKQIQESFARDTDIKNKRQAYEDSFFNSIESAYYEKMKQVGISGPQGYIEGAEEEKQEVELAISEVIRAGIDAAKEAQDSHSPSREYYRLGVWAIEGYTDAIKEALPIIKEYASQIKLNPDGSAKSPKDVQKANNLIDTLHGWGALRVFRQNPMNDIVDANGNVVSKGLTSLLGELPRTAKKHQIQKADVSQFKEFFDLFNDSYGIKTKGKKADTTKLASVLKEMGLATQDINTMVGKYTEYMDLRAKEINTQRAQLKKIIGNLKTNNDKTTISKRGNESQIREAFDLYNKSYKNTFDKNGINEETFKKFASEMGLSDENAQRVKEMFDKLFVEMWDNIEKTKQQCVDAAEQVKQTSQEGIVENGNLESSIIEKNEQAKLDAIEATSKEQEKANKEEEKKRQKLIADLNNIANNEKKYMESYRQQALDAATSLEHGGDYDSAFGVYKASDQRMNLVEQNGLERYYDIVAKVNRLLSNKNLSGALHSQLQELADDLAKIDPRVEHSQQEFQDLSLRLKQAGAEAEKAGKTFINTVFDRLRKANADFFARYFSIRDIIRYFRTFMQTITEYDTALTEMRKVSDESVASLEAYQKATFGVADALGTTALQVQQSTADWLRLGESMDEASKSAATATMLFNVSEFENVGEATQALVAMSQAYKDLDKTEIIDVMNNIGNNYAIATDELATALQASSAALMTQGNDLYEAAALVTAGNQIIQDASKTGTGIRTIALRISGQKMGKEELEQELNELGEEVDEWVMQTESKKREAIMEYTKVAANNYLGVDILDANGNLKDTYHILLDISKVYKDIQEEDKKFGTNRAQALVEELAGKVRSNIAASILMNPEILESVYNDAMNSMGSAAEENAKYLDSIAGKTAQLQNEWQKFQMELLDSDMLKNLLDLAKWGLGIVNDLIDKIPNLTVVVGALAAAILAMSKNVFFASEGSSVLKLAFDGLKYSLFGVTTAQTANTVATEAGTVAIEEQTAATEAQIAADKTAAIVSKAKNGAIAIAITVGLALLAKLITYIANYRKELKRAANESRDAIKTINSDLKDAVKTVDEVGQKYAEMAQKVANLGKSNQSQGSLSSDEYGEFLEISNQLVEIFPSLQNGFDESGNSIVKLDGNVNEIVADLERLVQVEKEIAKQKMLDEAENIYKDDIKTYKDLTKFTGEYTKSVERLQSTRNKINDEQSHINKAIRGESELITGVGGQRQIFESEVSQMLSEVFGDKQAAEISQRIKVFKNGNDYFNYDELTETERASIENYYNNLVRTYEREVQSAKSEIDTINADLRKYMQMAVADSFTYQSSDAQSKAIMESVLSNFDVSMIPEDVKSWDQFVQWFENSFVVAISNMDEDLSDKMATVITDSTLNAVEKSDLISEILNSLSDAGFSPDNPLVIYWQSQYEGATEKTAQGVEHILGGMVKGTNDTEGTMRARAKSWVNQLTPDQYNALMGQKIEKGTIKSLQDIYDLLDKVDDKSKYTYDSIGTLLSSGQMADYSKTWGDIKDELVGLAQAGKLDENTLKEYEFYNKIIEELGLSAEEADAQISGMVDAINSMAQQNAVDVLNSYKNGVDSLADAYEKFQKGEFIDASTLSSIQDVFGDLDSYQEFEEAVMRGEENLQQYFDNIVTEYAIQESALAELTEENQKWVKQQLIASGITEESADKAIKQSLERKESIEGEIRATLELMNAEVVEKKGRDDLAVSTENLDKLTTEEIVLLMQEANMSGQAAQAVALFALKKELAKSAALRNQDDIQYLLQLINLADIGGKKVTELKYKLENQQRYQEKAEELAKKKKDFYAKHGTNDATYDYGTRQEWKAIAGEEEYLQNWLKSIDTVEDDVIDEINKQHPELDYTLDLDLDYGGAVDSAADAGTAAGESFKEHLDKILAMYDAELDAGVVAFQTYVDKSRAIIEQYYQEGKITASEYYDYIASLYEKQVSEYDKVINAVTRRIQKETEALEKQKEAIEESYNLQIEEIQKKIDTLQEENDEIDRNIALQKAQ